MNPDVNTVTHILEFNYVTPLHVICYSPTLSTHGSQTKNQKRCRGCWKFVLLTRGFFDKEGSTGDVE